MHAYKSVHMSVHMMSVHMHVCTHACLYTCMSVHMHVCAHACLYTYMSVHILYTCLYTCHTHMPTRIQFYTCVYAEMSVHKSIAMPPRMSTRTWIHMVVHCGTTRGTRAPTPSSQRSVCARHHAKGGAPACVAPCVPRWTCLSGGRRGVPLNGERCVRVIALSRRAPSSVSPLSTHDIFADLATADQHSSMDMSIAGATSL